MELGLVPSPLWWCWGWPVPLAALAALLRTSSVALAVPTGHTALHQAPEKPRGLGTDPVRGGLGCAGHGTRVTLAVAW